MQFMAKGTGINIALGEKDISPKGGHIMVTTPNYVKAKLDDRK